MRPDSSALKSSRRSGIGDSRKDTTRLAAVRWAEGNRGCGTSFYKRVGKMSTGWRLSLGPLLPCCYTRPEGHIRHGGPRKFPPQSDAPFPSALRNPRSPTGSDSRASSEGLSTVLDRRRTRRVRRAARREHGRPCAANRRDYRLDWERDRLHRFGSPRDSRSRSPATGWSGLSSGPCVEGRRLDGKRLGAAREEDKPPSGLRRSGGPESNPPAIEALMGIARESPRERTFRKVGGAPPAGSSCEWPSLS